MADSTYTVACSQVPFETDYYGVVGSTEHIPVLVKSFELKTGQLFVDGEASVDGGLTINLYNIHKIRKFRQERS